MTSAINTPEMMFFAMLATLFISSVVAKISHIPGIIVLILGGVILGPDGLNVLPLNDTINSFATIGLIFLMFSVGLEIDLSQFHLYRQRAIIFFLFTYLIPQLSGLIIGPILGLSLGSSILLGAIYASYTLVAYPLVSKMGILKNEAVGLSVSANVFCDITALFILTIVLNTHAGNFTWQSLGFLALVIVLSSACILFIIPYLGRLFFRFFSDAKINFPFVLLILFASATIAHLVGMHAVVGAFLGGLAVNRMVTPQSRVFRQVLFTANTIFIPLFLISIGVRLNLVKIFSSWDVLIVGLTLTITVYATKFIAAWLASRLFNYSRSQMWTMWGLTQGQAAATLAIILIGTRAHLFNDTILQGSIVMVLFTLLSSPLIVKYYGSRLEAQPTIKKRHALLENIMVLVDSDDFPDNTLEFAARLARHGRGTLTILNVAKTAANLGARREILRAGPLKEPDTSVELINRLQGTSLSQEIIKETIESEISLIMMRWEVKEGNEEQLFSDHIDAIIQQETRPVAVVLLNNPIKSFKRVVALVGDHVIGIKLEEDFPKIAKTISHALDLPLTVMARMHYLEQFRSKKSKLRIHIVNKTFNEPLTKLAQIPQVQKLCSNETKLGRSMNKVLNFFSPLIARIHYPKWLHFKNVHLFHIRSFDFIPINTDIIDAALAEIKTDDLVLIPTMGSKNRFEKNPDLLTYNLWSKSKASLIILNLP